MEATLTTLLIDWYQRQGRDLPWRNTQDPYAIWVSEVMLQQTRVETVIPYFQRWMIRFPDPDTLAKADGDEVLNAWEGLGYYQRAHHLHHAARLLVEEYNGKLPRDTEDLQTLPGIGPYTAGAIASIAFGENAPAIDGNVRRVISRLFNVEHNIQSRRGQRAVRKFVEELLPPEQAGTFNQALMDLGAMICTPRSPSCGDCPVQNYCQAYQGGIQEQRPVRKKRETPPHHTVTAAVIQREGCVLLAKRPADALLGGMWEFPGGKQEEGERLPAALRREIEEELGVMIHVGEKLGVFQHAYTHFRVTLHAYLCTLQSRDVQLNYHTDWTWAPPDTLDDYPMGKIDRAIAEQLQTDQVSPPAP